MSVRADYAIEDLVLFSERVYDRMFELHNGALWPLHIVAVAIGIYLVFVALKPSPARMRAGLVLLSAVWLFVAGAFFYQRYATINWAAVYVVPAFVAMAAILCALAVRARPVVAELRSALSGRTAVMVLLFALVGYPLLGLLAGKSWLAAQVFAIAPDPTVGATLGFLVLCRGVAARVAMIVPVLWSVVTALTLYGLGSAMFVVTPAIAVLCVIVQVCASRESRPMRPVS